MSTICLSFVAIVAAVHMAVAQKVSGPGGEAGTNYFWPRYNYSNDEIHYKTKLALSSPYVCKWDVTLWGINANQGVLILPPCTYITPHWHPTTYELNFIMEGNLTYWVYPYGLPGKSTPPLAGYVPQGDAFMAPLGLQHLLFNNECDMLVMMHTFPSSTNEDFFSSWANVQQFPDAYLANVMPKNGNMVKGDLTTPDDIHTLSGECMASCGITQAYYENFHCPKELPLQKHILTPFAPTHLFQKHVDVDDQGETKVEKSE